MLVILVTLSATAIIQSWALGLAGSASKETKNILVVDEVLAGGGKWIIVYLRNTGAFSVNVSFAVLLRGGHVIKTWDISPSKCVPPYSVKAICLETGGLEPGIYTIKVFTESGDLTVRSFRLNDPEEVEIEEVYQAIGWSFYREVTIKEESGEDLIGYPILIELNKDNFDFKKAKSDGSDIRFLDLNGEKLSYWIESFDSEKGEAKIWVKLNDLSANGKKVIHMYYGNPEATDESSPSDVFSFYEDFENYVDGQDLTAADWSSRTWVNFGEQGDVNWIVEGVKDNMAVYVQVEGTPDRSILYKPLSQVFAKYAISMKVKPSRKLSLGLLISAFDAGHWYTLTVTSPDSRSSRIELIQNIDSDTKWWGYYYYMFSSDEWYNIEVQIRDNEIRGVLINGEPVGGFNGFTLEYGLKLVGFYVGVGSGSDGFLDSIILRKWVEPEPYVEVGEEHALT